MPEPDRRRRNLWWDPLAGIVIQGNEGLAFFRPMFLDEPADRVVTTRIAVLVTQPLKNPHRRMPLLRRLRLVIGENLKNPIVKRPQSGGRLPLPFRILPRCYPSVSRQSVRTELGYLKNFV